MWNIDVLIRIGNASDPADLQVMKIYLPIRYHLYIIFTQIKLQYCFSRKSLHLRLYTATGKDLSLEQRAVWLHFNSYFNESIVVYFYICIQVWLRKKSMYQNLSYIRPMAFHIGNLLVGILLMIFKGTFIMSEKANFCFTLQWHYISDAKIHLGSWSCR